MRNKPLYISSESKNMIPAHLCNCRFNRFPNPLTWKTTFSCNTCETDLLANAWTALTPVNDLTNLRHMRKPYVFKKFVNLNMVIYSHSNMPSVNLCIFSLCTTSDFVPLCVLWAPLLHWQSSICLSIGCILFLPLIFYIPTSKTSWMCKNERGSNF